MYINIQRERETQTDREREGERTDCINIQKKESQKKNK